jgi:DNA polymerase-3 subunit gamma/tau
VAHRSWYRTYRPQRFDDVVGQSHIERTLRNAVEEGNVAHAYLFTGPRGTGKTTTARILAKALNCENGPTPEPDDTCDDCVAITEGRHPDVYELDAASRTGVDAVREEIIGRVHFAPTRGHWKVYIIDEVHMLSTAAFNALLKTLEEPPANTVFILCTTHAHKVPETIHSRCQRFDFHRLSVEEIASRLRFIADAEHVTVDDGALSLMARHALGGMRDAITTLEQLASFTGGQITRVDVEGLLGEVDAEVLFEAADLVLERDVAGAFALVATLAEQGVDMTEFVKAYVRHSRDLFVVAAVPRAGDSVDVTSNDRTRLEAQARAFGIVRLARVLDVLDRLSSEMRFAADQRLAVEVALTRLARPETDLTLESLAERIAALESGARVPPPVTHRAASVASAAPVPVAAAAPSELPSPPSTPARDAAAVEAPAPRAPDEASASAPAAATAPTADGSIAAACAAPLDAMTVKRAWPAVQAEFRKLRPSRSHLFDNTEVELADGEIAIEFPANQRFSLEMAQAPETVQLLRRCLADVLGVTPPIAFRLGRQGSSTPDVAACPEPAPSPDSSSESDQTPRAVPATAEAAVPDVTLSPEDVSRLFIDQFGAELLAEDDHGDGS